MEPRKPQTLRRHMSAFADGELDPASARQVLEQLLADPAALEALRRIQQLTTTTRRIVHDSTPGPSEALMERLRQMTPSPAPTLARIERPEKMQWFSFARAIAATVLLAVGIWVGTQMAKPTAPIVTPTADVLPASVIANAEEIHSYCSRLAMGLHSGGYPADIAALADTVAEDLHSAHPYPDLMPIGYRYRGSSPCGTGLPGTAHLLYRDVRPGSVEAISVFVQPWKGQYPLDAGRLYTVSVDSSPFPMLAWRTDRIVYFLLADNARTERAAVGLIRGAPATHPAPGQTP